MKLFSSAPTNMHKVLFGYLYWYGRCSCSLVHHSLELFKNEDKRSPKRVVGHFYFTTNNQFWVSWLKTYSILCSNSTFTHPHSSMDQSLCIVTSFTKAVNVNYTNRIIFFITQYLISVSVRSDIFYINVTQIFEQGIRLSYKLEIYLYRYNV